MSDTEWVRYELGTLTAVPIRSGTYVPKNLRGRGSKLVNMGELFANPRLFDIEMERVPISAEDELRFGLQVGDLLFARRSMIGTGASQCSVVCALEHGSVFDSSLIRVRVDSSRVVPHFLFYFFWSPEGKAEVASIGRHGPISGITGKDLATLSVPVPFLEEQRVIARVLGSLDDKIELNRRMNQTLEDICRALFKFWFVDFGPVRAKKEGRWKKGESLPGMPADMWDLWPSEFEESEIGEVPKGWKVGHLEDLATVTMGQSPPGSTYNEEGEGVPFYQGVRDFSRRFPTRRVYCTAPSRFAEAGDVLLSVRAPVGRTNIATEKCAIGRGLGSVRFRRGGESFGLCLLNAQVEVWEALDAKGTVFGAATRDDVRKLPVLAPPDQFIERFETFSKPVDCALLAFHGESETLSTVRDALLPKLLSGEIRVKVDA